MKTFIIYLLCNMLNACGPSQGQIGGRRKRRTAVAVQPTTRQAPSEVNTATLPPAITEKRQKTQPKTRQSSNRITGQLNRARRRHALDYGDPERFIFAEIGFTRPDIGLKT